MLLYVLTHVGLTVTMIQIRREKVCAQSVRLVLERRFATNLISQPTKAKLSITVRVWLTHYRHGSRLSCGLLLLELFLIL